MLTSQTDDGLQQVWRFLNSMWPIGGGVEVVFAQENGVTLPSDPCIMLNSISARRLEWNVRSMSDDQQLTITKQVQVKVQIDFFGLGAQGRASQFTTLWRDAYAVDWFKSQGLSCRPLYASEPTQIQFINESDNFEQRWMCVAELQIAQSVSVDQQSAINPGIIGVTEVDGRFP